MARILVVDDEDVIRRLLSGYLGYRGHTVATAENGEQGFAIIQAGNVDLVISDLQMPVMNGATMLIAANFPRAILASGKFGWLETDAERVAEFPVLASLIGRCVFLAKPFNWDMLMDAVNRILADPQ